MLSKKNTEGFSLIETLVAVLLTAVISSALLLGITQTKIHLESVKIKERAFIELKNSTNKWKSLVAAGYESFHNDGRPEIVSLKQDSRGKTLVEGKIYKNVIYSNLSGEYSVYYKIDTYITWESPTAYFSNNNKLDTLRFKTYQIQYPL